MIVAEFSTERSGGNGNSSKRSLERIAPKTVVLVFSHEFELNVLL
jgi:hypothetical protein